jgi:protein-disulfide isomerase
MTPGTKKILAGVILTLIPIAGVHLARQTAWGTVANTPKARIKGDLKAPVVMVEYSDFQCPMCARVQPSLQSLLERYQGKVRLIYKYYPLTSIHRNAVSAAVSAECAARQDKFWPYQDRLFQTQTQWASLINATTVYAAIAQEVQLNMDAFSACRMDPSAQQIVMQDAAEAKSRQVTSTPTLFVGEQRLVGGMIEIEGARMVERELRNRS